MPDDDVITDDDLVETDQDTDLVRRLRRKLDGAGKRLKDFDTLAEQNKTLAEQNRVFQMTGLLSDAGLSDLGAEQRETLSEWALKQEQVDADALRARAVALKWAEPVEDPADREITEQERIANAQRGGGGAGKEITPTEAANWDQGQVRAFRTKHPDLFEALKRGDSVRRPAA